MTTEEKKCFREVIKLQIAEYESHIDRGERYIGQVGSCPICDTYMIDMFGPGPSQPKCIYCPLLNFRIYFNENYNSQSFPCSRRLTYPGRIWDYINNNSMLREWSDLYKYEMEGEKAALQFWNKMLKLVTKTLSKHIDFSENSAFVMQMIWIDKVVAKYWEKTIDEKFIIIENIFKKVTHERTN
jgi:hypothetical protein